MIDREAATEDKMIAAFLEAEGNPSSYWSHCVEAGLQALGAGRSLIDTPDLKDPDENRWRKRILDSYRGYERREDLFARFPHDVVWSRVDLEAGDFETMHYMAHRSWNELSRETRLVSVGARNLPRFAFDKRFQHIYSIIQAIREGKHFPPLIAVQHDGGHLVLIEGHSRATAYAAVSFASTVDAFVGSSPSMNRWAFY